MPRSPLTPLSHSSSISAGRRRSHFPAGCFVPRAALALDHHVPRPRRLPSGLEAFWHHRLPWGGQRSTALPQGLPAPATAWLVDPSAGPGPAAGSPVRVSPSSISGAG